MVCSTSAENQHSRGGEDRIVDYTLYMGPLGLLLRQPRHGVRPGRSEDQRVVPHQLIAVVVPVLAHLTWHLYRRVVEPAASG